MGIADTHSHVYRLIDIHSTVSEKKEYDENK